MNVARLLIEHGADAVAQSKDGTTPLHQASERGHVNVAQLLIEHGADAAPMTKSTKRFRWQGRRLGRKLMQIVTWDRK